MKSYKVVFSCLVLLLSQQVLTAQNNVFFKKLLKKDGLSQSSVFSIAQDSSGFIWLGTRDGLNKYDGYGFSVYKSNQQSNSIVSNDIRTLYYDHSHSLLWIGTNAGLSRFHTAHHRFDNFQHTDSDTFSISSNTIRQVYRDRTGKLWVATADGLNLMDEETNTFEVISPNQTYGQSPGIDINVICETQQGYLLIGSEIGLFVVASVDTGGHTLQRIPQAKQLLDNIHIKCMVEDDEHNLWIGTQDRGLVQWHPDTEVLTYCSHSPDDLRSLSHNNVRDLCIDANNNLWIGTFNGLNLLKTGEQHFVRYAKSIYESNGLSDKSIRSLFQDDQGSLWIGTYYGGVNVLDSNFMPTELDDTPISNNLKGNVVSSFAEQNGHIWVGTEGNGLKYLDKNGTQIDNKVVTRINKLLADANVKNIFLDDDDLWVGTFQRGLHRFDLDSDRHSKYTASDPNSISADNIYGILKNKNKLWLLTYGSGLDLYDTSTSQFYNYSHNPEDDTSISSDLSRCILLTQKGQLWIGTESGLNKVELSENGLPLSFLTYISHEKIYSLTEDENEHIWIGTFDNGLYKFDQYNNVFEHYTSADGLPSNTILGVMEANNKELWVSTNDGLCVYNPAQKTFSKYGHPSIIDNSEYNYNAYYKTTDGSMLFGGVNGYTQFSPELLSHNTYVPPIVLTLLKRNNKAVQVGDDSGILSTDINDTESITFDYNEANFSVSFAALDFFSPENNHYATFMEGIDNEWNYAVGETEATYTLQREGTYVLKIKGGNNEGVYNPDVRTLEIIVLPPVWRTWWAYLLYLLALGLVLAAVIRYFRLNGRLQLEKITNQQQEELHEVKMRFYTNITHEFRTPLTLIVAPINDLLSNNDLPEPVVNKLKSINRNAGRLLNLANQILNFRKLDKDHISLKIVQRDFSEFLKEIFLMFSETAHRRNITYECNLSGALQLYYDQDKLEKVFYNLLSNAFKFTPDGGRILVSLSVSESHVDVRVQDSGVGVPPGQRDQIFKRFYEKSDLTISRIKGTGIGLSLSKQMVELHQGTIELEAGTTALSGASFLVRLPLGRAHFKDIDIVDTVIATLDDMEIKEQGFRDNRLGEQPASHIGENGEHNQTHKSDHQRAHLLIVEDNEEVRRLLVELFSADYTITEAVNGAAALNMVKSVSPDLIISDVMMPIMDGITFCNKLKSDLEVSHIPLLLLTARTAALFRIDGLKNGADDYITKPFIPQELQLKVKNMLRSRRVAREKFARMMNFDPKEVNLASRDEIFLERAIKVVDENMDNVAFNVNQFASKLTVSRPLLFTKLKALTGQTPNNFVKTIRLKRAAQLIKTRKFNIGEVAQNVGFKDTKYFGKCFKEQFGTSPTKYNEV